MLEKREIKYMIFYTKIMLIKGGITFASVDVRYNFWFFWYFISLWNNKEFNSSGF
jgi:hypothetical protein